MPGCAHRFCRRRALSGLPSSPRTRPDRKGFALIWPLGEVAEWLNAPHSKCGIGASLSGVRIPPSPPLFLTLFDRAVAGLGSPARHGTGGLFRHSSFKGRSKKALSRKKPNAWVAAVPANSATPPGARQHRSGVPASRADRAHVRKVAPLPSRVHPLQQSPVWLEVKAPVVSDFSSASRRPYSAQHDANRTLFKISRVIIR